MQRGRWGLRWQGSRRWQRAGKAACKAALQQELGLPVASQTPLVALVGRLADQKGWDLVAEVMRRWVNEMDVQWAILGTGEPPYHDLLGELSRHHPGKVAARLEFSDPLAHRFEAGADMFLMPSRFEPCGLNQMYSMRYGTVPVVRATGGLDDTVTDYNGGPTAGTGFKFKPYAAPALRQTLERAKDAFANPQRWKALQLAGMRQDFSWDRSAREYVKLYEDTRARPKGYIGTVIR